MRQRLSCPRSSRRDHDEDLAFLRDEWPELYGSLRDLTRAIPTVRAT